MRKIRGLAGFGSVCGLNSGARSGTRAPRWRIAVRDFQQLGDANASRHGGKKLRLLHRALTQTMKTMRSADEELPPPSQPSSF